MTTILGYIVLLITLHSSGSADLRYYLEFLPEGNYKSFNYSDTVQLENSEAFAEWRKLTKALNDVHPAMEYPGEISNSVLERFSTTLIKIQHDYIQSEYGGEHGKSQCAQYENSHAKLELLRIDFAIFDINALLSDQLLHFEAHYDKSTSIYTLIVKRGQAGREKRFIAFYDDILLSAPSLYHIKQMLNAATGKRRSVADGYQPFLEAEEFIPESTSLLRIVFPHETFNSLFDRVKISSNLNPKQAEEWREANLSLNPVVSIRAHRFENRPVKLEINVYRNDEEAQQALHNYKSGSGMNPEQIAVLNALKNDPDHAKRNGNAVILKTIFTKEVMNKSKAAVAATVSQIQSNRGETKLETNQEQK